MISKVVKYANSMLDVVLSPLKMKHVSVAITMMLVLYSATIAPQPPQSLKKVLDTKVGRLVALSLLALVLAKGDRALAGMALVTYLVTVSVMDRPKLIDQGVGLVEDVATRVQDVASELVGEVKDLVVEDKPKPVEPLAELDGVVN